MPLMVLKRSRASVFSCSREADAAPRAAFVLFVLVFFFFVFGFRHFGGRGFLDGVRVDQAVDQFVDAHFVALDLGGHVEDVGDRRRAGGDRLDHVLEAFLDALGDLDFAFAGEEFDRAHFAHVHADRVGGAAKFGIDGGQRLLGLRFDFFVVGCRCGGVGHQQVFGSRGFVEDLDAHFAEGRDDGFDGLGIDDIVGQVVVDLGVGQVAALLAQLDQGLEAHLARFGIERFRSFSHLALQQRLLGCLLLGLAGASLRASLAVSFALAMNTIHRIRENRRFYHNLAAF
jgi:hypothetical protein